MDKTEELMVITMEECGELIQACSKAIRRGEMFKNSDSEVTFKEECGDVFCMLELLVDNGFVTWQEIANRSEIKRNKLKKWSKLIDDAEEQLRKGYEAGVSHTHPPKSEQTPFSFPLNNYNISYTQYGYPTYEEKMESIEDTGWRRALGDEPRTKPKSIDDTPMSEYEEKEWQRLEKITKKL
jgi:NTP pyrophosphatase (non-canonical NTP hydrolase)